VSVTVICDENAGIYQRKNIAIALNPAHVNESKRTRNVMADKKQGMKVQQTIRSLDTCRVWGSAYKLFQ